jgi:hypothetical protein
MPNMAYPIGARVVAGPGWLGGQFINGAPLWLWALAGAGGTSGVKFPEPPTRAPAGVGGGLDGIEPAGWASATHVTDNGLTWVCLSPVDYVTYTDAMTDGHGIVTTYSSKAKAWPGQGLGFTLQYNTAPIFQVWYGGTTRPIYQAGKHGENDPMPMQDHTDFRRDEGQPTPPANFVPLPDGPYWKVCAASGDGHADRRAAGWQSDPATRVDPSLGVTFFSDSSGNDDPGTGAPIGLSDSLGTFIGLQFRSVNWLAFPCHGFYLPGYSHVNNVTIDTCVVQSDSGSGTMAVDGGWIFRDSAIIYLGTSQGAFGVVVGYSMDLIRTTLTAPNHPVGSVAIAQQGQFSQVRSSMRDNRFVGFAHDWAYSATETFLMDASGNRTDLPANYVGGPVTLSLGQYGSNFIAAPLPGRIP